jgi:hypothetical protein
MEAKEIMAMLEALQALQEGQCEILKLLRKKGVKVKNGPDIPESLEEVQEFYSGKCDEDSSWLTFDLERWYDIREANCWIKQNNAPIRSWKRQMGVDQKDGWCVRKSVQSKVQEHDWSEFQ